MKIFFRAHRTNDLTRKLEKVGPFECDELEKHCRVSAKCYLICFRAHRTNDLTKKLEKVGPFECDELITVNV